MADKDFGAKRINLIGATGTPTITSPTDLIIKANNVAISTNTTIGGRLGIGTTNPTTTVSIAGTLSFPNNNIKIGDNTTGCSITSGTDNFFAGSEAGRFNTTGYNNNFIGRCAGRSNTSGTYNNFFGFRAGCSNTGGCNNNFFGQDAGKLNTNGGYNNFFGRYSGRSNTNGCCNNFVGNNAGCSNTTGYDNNFFGSWSGRGNTTGYNNNFFGKYAGYNNNSGSNNTFIGNFAGCSNTTGCYNNFFGLSAGNSNTTGNSNNFFGTGSGSSNISGRYNNFFGPLTGQNNTSGNNNNFIGRCAGKYNTIGSGNNFFGNCAGKGNTIGSNNNFSGNCAGLCNTTGSNNNFSGNYVGFANTSGSNNNFFGTNAGRCNTSGNCNNFFGYYAGCSNTDGSNNNFFGQDAGKLNTTGSYNNFFGFRAGCSNTSGVRNNFFGQCAGLCNTTGSCNIFIGFRAGSTNSSGYYNNFIGAYSGLRNTLGYENNFFGRCSGSFNTSGCYNNFFGASSGYCNSTGIRNNFFGDSAGSNNNTGCFNSFFGDCAGVFNTIGSYNAFFGRKSGDSNSSGSCNNFFGHNAGTGNTTGSCNVFFGNFAASRQTSGDRNVAIGYSVQLPNTTGSDQLAIGLGNTSWIIGNSSYNVGIGTTNPTSKLHVVGNSFFTGVVSFTNNNTRIGDTSTGSSITSGRYNNFFGVGAGKSNSTGFTNNFIGFYAGYGNTSGCFNNFFGFQAGLNNITGSYNNFFGKGAGYWNTVGNCNNFFGYYAGLNQTSGNRNVAIGYMVQLPNTTGSDQLNIGSCSNSWISGNSSFNVGLGTTNPTSKLWVQGDGYFTGVVTATTFIGNLTGIASTATNLAGGGEGYVPYQFQSGITSFVSGGQNGQVLLYDTGLKAPKWGSAGEASGAFPGIDVIDEDGPTITGIIVFNFRGDNITAVSDTASGISTIIANSNIVGTSLSISGITTLSNTVNISGSVGIGTTNPTSKLWVNGDGYFVGVVTSAGFYVNGELIGQGGISGTNLVGIALSVSGISTLGTVKISSGIVTATTGIVTFYGEFVGTATSAGYAHTAFNLNGTIESNLNVAYANTAGIATYATKAGVSTDVIGGIASVTSLSVDSTGISTLGTVKISSGIVTATTGIVTFYGNFVGTATSAGYATTAFNLNGTIESNLNVAYANTAGIASSVALDSVGLGTHTYGDYVKSISGTANQITVTGGTGEGSTPSLSIPTQFTVPQDLTVTRDVQINRNLNVTGNITIGGTTAFIDVQRFLVRDADLILGFRTDAFGNDASNDTTANHGGIAVASTEGNPLVNLTVAGIETLPATYKKIMWFKAGEFAGLGTDAWLSNYAIGIGSTQFPSGTRLAAGSVQFTENDLAVVRDINATGVITATKFVGSVGLASTATNLGAGNTGSLPYQNAPGITTFLSAPGVPDQILIYDTNAKAPKWGPLVGTGGAISGITVIDEGTTSLTNITTLDIYGSNIIASNPATGIASIRVSDNLVGTALSISGISTLGTVSISSGIVTATSGVVTYYGDGSKLTGVSGVTVEFQQLTGDPVYPTLANSAGVSSVGIATTGDNALVFIPSNGRLGIGTTNPDRKLHVRGDIKITGGIYDINDSSGSSNRVLTANGSGGWSWQPVTASGAISGIAINDDFNTNAPRYLLFTDATSGSVTTEYVSQTKLVFNPSSGNLGIGTTNPTEKLQVNGNISINGTTSYGSVTAITATKTQTAIHSGLSTSTYRSVEYIIQATQGTNYHVTKILSIHDGTTAYNSEYGTIFNNTSVGTFDVDVSGGNIRLLVTATSSESTNYTVNFIATKI